MSKGLPFFSRLILSLLAITSTCLAQTTISPTTWTGHGTSVSGASAFTTLPASTSPSSTSVNISQWNRGSGVAYNSAGSSYDSKSWSLGTTLASAKSGGNYIYFTVTNNSTTELEVTNIVLQTQVSTTGPGSIQMQYASGSSGDVALGSVYTVSSRGSGISNTFTPSSPIHICAGITDTFKVYGYNATNTLGTMRVNNSTSITAKYVTALTASATSNAPLCVGAGSLVLNGAGSNGKTFPTGATYRYSWSGPASFSNTNGTTGITTPTTAASGTYSVTVTDNWGCTAKATVRVLINPSSSAGTVSGATTLCVGAATTYSTTGTSGGTWSSSNAAIASVNATTGLVSGLSSGSATIKYSVADSCHIDTATSDITIASGSSSVSITGTTTVCQTTTITLAASVAGGTWSSSDATIASIDPSTGVVTGVRLGSAIISYTVSGSCGTGLAVVAVTVYPLPSAGVISGIAPCIAGSSVFTASGTSGGSWSSSNTAVASINSLTGDLYGVSIGSATITYSISNYCGTNTATQGITINAVPSAGSLTGADTICSGASTTYSSSGTSGGTWSSSNVTVASVNSSTGQVFGVSAGSAIITYSVSTVCGTNTATKIVIVSASPSAGTVTGISTLCVGAAATFTSSGVSGGTWSSTNTSVAVVNSTTGRVSGEATGSATISYMVSNSCGTNVAVMDIVVSPLPSAGIVSGATSVCPAHAITLTASGSTGGTWSSSNTALATVDASGNVTGISFGAVTISYTVTNACGTDYALQYITVSTAPTAGTVIGTSPLCAGGTAIYASVGASVGAWSSSNTSIVSIDSSTGDVVAIAAGTATISFTVSSPCGTNTATQAVTVTNSLSAGTISGTDTICASAATTYASSGAASGGWSSSNTSVATVNSSTGNVFGVSAGSAAIRYVTTTACGNDTATKVIIVNTAPSAGGLTGTSPLCVGAASNYTSSGASGGTWSSSNTSIAVVNSATGRVSGESTGSATITYTVSNSCGTNTAISNITVAPLPSAGVLSGVTTLCAATTSTIVASGSTGGTWSSSNTGIATVDSTGNVTGISSGAVTISYSVSNSCGTDYALQYMTINTAPSSGTVIGTSPLCVGGTAIYAAVSAAAGAWSSSNTAVVSIDSTTGDVVAVGAGSATISYTVTSACGTNVSTQSVIVNAAPSSGTVIGTSPICISGSATYTSSGATGGTWSSSNTSVASVNSSTGDVFGVGTGSATISYTVTGACGTNTTTQSVTVNTAPPAGTMIGTSPLCMGASATYSSSGTSGGTWASSNTSVVSVNGTTGDVVGMGAGSATISYTVSNACGTNTATGTAVVITAPSAGTVTGTSPLCVGAASNYTSSGASGGTWSSSNTSIAVVNSATGRVSGESTGSATITYTVSNLCGTNTAISNITVAPLPSAGVLSGVTTLCAATTSTIVASGSTGGTWSSSNTSTATVDSTGNVTGISSGAVTISYSVSNSCGTDYALQYMTINTAPSSGTVIGTSPLCVGGTAIYAAVSAAAGAWSSSNTAVVSIDSTTGDVVAVGAGSATISYTVTSACGTNVSTQSVIVNAAPSSGTVTGISLICISGAATYTSSGATGGTWSSSNTSVASVNSSTGDVFGVGTGSATISYTVTGACGTNTTTQSVTVITTPSAGILSGITTLCAGADARFTSSGVSGGTWISSNSAIATIDSSGNLTGVSAGNAIISYSVSNICGTNIATRAMTVIVAPSSGTITGTTTLCVASTAIYTSSGATGGSWSSSSPSIASVNSSTGAITGVAAGSATITYTVTNTCGTNTTTQGITINPLPFAGAISGPSSVCTGSSVGLISSGTSGGTWSSSSTTRATVDGSGNVTGVAIGTAIISYSVSNSCGTDITTSTETINTVASGGTISGVATVCQSANITLTTTGTGGTWSSATPSIATISPAGLVYGVSPGSASISYTVPGVCGAGIATTTITVNPLPNAGTISGIANICQLTSSPLTASVTGGVWSSSNTSVATVNSAGSVYGITSGSASISYVVTNSCGTANATSAITINAAPGAGGITGSTTLCASATTSFTSSGTAGGTWTSSNAAVASVNASTGSVTGVATGRATITYTVSGLCGTNSASLSTTINPLPNAGTISGAFTFCPGTSTTLIDSATGGTWSSTTASVATVNSTGRVTGLIGGTTTISYTVTNSCGVAAATAGITINPTPNAGTLSGASVVCVNAVAAMTSTGTGGTWSSSNTAIVTVDPGTGSVRGIASGAATISYIATNSCGTSTATRAITVNPLPVAGTISGASSICVAASVTFTSSVGTSGTWSSSNTAFATVSTAGRVYGASEGSVVISYSVTNSCGTDVATRSVSILPLPNAGALSGPSAVCVTASVTITSSGTGGGSWASSNGSIAVVTSTGLVTGLTAGTVYITYTVVNTCGLNSATQSVTVAALPTASVTGASTICASASTTFTTTATGGTWSSSNPLIASVNPSTGTVAAVGIGSATISYSYTAPICGAAVANRAVTVIPIPFAGTISGRTVLSAGVSNPLSFTGSGGSFSSTDTTIATINSAGVLTGVSNGTCTISYFASNICGTSLATRRVRITDLYFFNGSQQNMSICASITNSSLNSQLSTNCAVLGRTLTWTTISAPSRGTLLISGTAASTGGLVSPPSAFYTPTAGYVGNDSFKVRVSDGFTADTTIVYVQTRSLPATPVVSGPTSVCVGATIGLTASPASGTWNSNLSTQINLTSSGASASVTAVGSTGVAPIIYYTFTDSTGCISTATYPMAVVVPGTIFGITCTGSGTIVCPGASFLLANLTPGGTWSSLYPTIATVTSGRVTALSPGRDTILYTVINACGAISAKWPFTVTGPTIPVIGGSGAPICIGASVTLTGTTGGTWSHTAPSVTSLTSAGVVTGLSGGVDTVKYALVNSCGLTGIATRLVTVFAPLAPPGTISGPTTVAVGGTITLTTTGSGGTWSSALPAIAVIGVGGFLRGNAVGIDTLKYTVSNSCSTAVARYIVTVTAHRGEINTTAGSAPSASVRLYPNPTNGLVTLEINGANNNAEITITDISGKVINSAIATDGTLDIDMTNVPRGIYLFTVRTNGNTYREKVVVQ